jgi:serine/threonine protein kinase
MSELRAFGRYTILRALGQGSTATVYLATDATAGGEAGGARVALKILHSQLSLDPVVRERFRRELEVSRRLDHPNIVRIYDHLAQGERIAAVMEYCPGGSLAEKGRITAEEATDWLRSLAHALALAHGRGLVHRDIKPENILFAADGSPKLCDFGSAQVQDLMGLTATTTFLSTPLYMPPEGSFSQVADPRWDLYSLGAVFYQALSGRPHRGTGLADLLASDAKRPTSLADLVPGLPPRLSALIDALLRPKEDRPRHAEAIIDFLDGRVELETHEGKHCLFCGAAMAPDSPVCLGCGRADLYPASYEGSDAQTVVLQKVPEDAEAMSALFAFMKAWTGEEGGKIRFLTEDARMYSKAERAEAVRLPHPLIAHLEPALADLLVAIITKAGTARVRAVSMASSRAERRFRKKKPLLPTLRPWPQGAAASFFERHPLPPALAEEKAGGRLYGDLLLDSWRLVDRLALRGAATEDLVTLVDRLAEAYGKAVRAMEALEHELEAFSPGELYLESVRIDALMGEKAELSTRDYEELLERRRRNRLASERYESLSRDYGVALSRLLESGTRLRRLLASIEAEGETEDLGAILAELEGGLH